MTDTDGSRFGERTSWLSLLAIFALWVALFWPNHGLAESAREEGRRVLTSTEMIETGDWMLPTIWGKPYLTKPPFMFWCIAVASLPGGEVTLGSARLPSMLATLGTALFLCFLGTRFGSRKIGLLAACVFLATPMVGEKGTLAETDAVLTFCGCVALGCAFLGRQGARWAWVVSALALTGAVMTKGPAAYVFFFAGPVALLIVDRGRAVRFFLCCLGVGAASLALSSLWLFALLASVEGDTLATTWAAEVKRGDHNSIAIYLRDIWRFLIRAFAGFLPASLVFAFSKGMRRAEGQGRTELERLALGCVVAGFLFFTFYPGTRARYAYPILPWLALLSGFVLRDGMRTDAAGLPRLACNAFISVVGTVGVLAGVAAVASLFGLSVEDLELGASGLAFGFGMAASGIFAILSLRKRRRVPAVLATLIVLFLVRGFTITKITPHRAAKHDFVAKAARVDFAIPEGVRVHTANWGDFNLFAHAKLRATFTDTPFETVEVGEILLVEKTWVEEQGGEASLGQWEKRIQVPVRLGRELVVLRRLEK